MRYLQGGSIDPKVYAVPIDKGGTGAIDAVNAARNLLLVTQDMKNVPGGVIGLDSSGRVSSSVIPPGIDISGANNIQGLTALTTSQSSAYTITDYDVFATYTLAVIGGLGSISRSGATITYTAPSSAGNYGFTVNGKAFNIVVGTAATATPSITSPLTGATTIPKNVTLTSSAFAMSVGFDTQYSADWQVATDAGFTSVVTSSIDDTTNKTSWTSGALSANTVYYARVRHKATAAGYSSYSATISFTTKAVFTPTLEQAKLTASDKAANNYFGYSVAITADGSRAIIGAYQAKSGGLTSAGQTYIFSKSGSTWTQEQILSASDKVAGDLFGFSVAISLDGTRCIVGAYKADSSPKAQAGKAYIFSRSGTVWTQEQILLASDKDNYAQFGFSVFMDTNGVRAVIGANQASPSGFNNAGASYVFSRSGTVWTQEQILTASDKAVNDAFGVSVSMDTSGTRIIVGAPAADPSSISEAGKVYVYSRSGVTWTQEQILSASDKAASNDFGCSVAISADGTRCVIGSRYSDYSSYSNPGRAYIFSRSGTVWTQEQILSASDGITNDLFGWSVSINIDGSSVAIGCPNSDIGGFTDCGAVYIFTRVTTTWSQITKLSASDKSSANYFGRKAKISSDGASIIVGAYNNSPSGVTGAGAAYIFI